MSELDFVARMGAEGAVSPNPSRSLIERSDTDPSSVISDYESNDASSHDRA